MIGRPVFMFSPLFVLMVVLGVGLFLAAVWPKKRSSQGHSLGGALLVLLIVAAGVVFMVTVIGYMRLREDSRRPTVVYHHYEPGWGDHVVVSQQHGLGPVAVVGQAETTQRVVLKTAESESVEQQAADQACEVEVVDEAAVANVNIDADQPLPSWANQQELTYDADRGVFESVVHWGPDDPLNFFEDKLNLEVKEAIHALLRKLYPSDNLAEVYVGIRDEELPTWRNLLVTATATKNHERLVGEDLPPVELRESWLKLEFDKAAQRMLRTRYEEAVVQRRLTTAGFAAGATMAMLATLFGFLKLDTATKGFYTGRLRLAAVALILVLLGLAGSGVIFFVRK